MRAGAQQEMRLPITPPPAGAPGVEYWLNVRALLAQATPWAPAGHVITWEQFALPSPPAATAPRTVRAMPPLALEDSAECCRVSGDTFRVLFNRAAGQMVSWRAGGRELLLSGPRENFFRAPTDNDLLVGYDFSYLQQWRHAGVERLHTDGDAHERAGTLRGERAGQRQLAPARRR